MVGPDGELGWSGWEQASRRGRSRCSWTGHSSVPRRAGRCRCGTRPPARSSGWPGWPAPADVDLAVATALPAQRAWSERTYAERAGLLRAAATVLADRAKEWRELIMRETGCIAGKADYEIGAAASELTEAAALASRATGEGAALRARRPVLAVRADPARAGRRHHPVELPARPRHAGDRPRARPGQRGAGQAVPGDALQRRAGHRRRCSRPPGRHPASSRCCPATSRRASGWSATPTWP